MSTIVQPVGFFAEFNRYQATGRLSLRDFVRPHCHPQAVDIVAYLRGGKLTWASNGSVHDVLADRWTPVGGTPGYLRTDGTWVWPDELAYYIEKYHVELPDEFVRHMAAHGFIPPVPPDDEELQIEGWKRIG